MCEVLVPRLGKLEKDEWEYIRCYEDNTKPEPHRRVGLIGCKGTFFETGNPTPDDIMRRILLTPTAVTFPKYIQQLRKEVFDEQCLSVVSIFTYYAFREEILFRFNHEHIHSFQRSPYFDDVVGWVLQLFRVSPETLPSYWEFMILCANALLGRNNAVVADYVGLCLDDAKYLIVNEFESVYNHLWFMIAGYRGLPLPSIRSPANFNTKKMIDMDNEYMSFQIHESDHYGRQSLRDFVEELIPIHMELANNDLNLIPDPLIRYEVELFSPPRRALKPWEQQKRKEAQDRHVAKMKSEIQQQKYKLQMDRNARLAYWTAACWESGKYSLSPLVQSHTCFRDSIWGQARVREQWGAMEEVWGVGTVNATLVEETGVDVVPPSDNNEGLGTSVNVSSSVDGGVIQAVSSNKRTRYLCEALPGNATTASSSMIARESEVDTLYATTTVVDILDSLLPMRKPTTASTTGSHNESSVLTSKGSVCLMMADETLRYEERVNLGETIFMLDLGSPEHLLMAPVPEFGSMTIRRHMPTIILGNGRRVYPTLAQVVRVLQYAFVISDIHTHILSVAKIASLGLRVLIHDNSMSFRTYESDSLMLCAKRCRQPTGHLYYVRLPDLLGFLARFETWTQSTPVLRHTWVSPVSDLEERYALFREAERGLGESAQLVVDSGATHHVVTRSSLLINFQRYRPPYPLLYVADGSSVSILGYGTLSSLGQAWYAPNMRCNVLSTGVLDDHGMTTEISNGVCSIVMRSTGKLILYGQQDNFSRLFRVSLSVLSPESLRRQCQPEALHPTSRNPPVSGNEMSYVDRMVEEDEKRDEPGGYNFHSLMLRCDPQAVADDFVLVVDSGCSAHMFNTCAYLDEVMLFPVPRTFVNVANGGQIPVVGQGRCGALGEVLYVPALSHNLLSPRLLDKGGYSTTFHHDRCEIVHRESGQTLLPVHYDHDLRLYIISQLSLENMLGIQHQACLAHSMKRDAISRIHYAFNHISADRIRYLCKCHKFPGLSSELSVRMFEGLKDCEFCRRTKVHHPITKQTVPRSQTLGEIWYVDVKGKIATPSLLHGNHYVFGLIESKSRYLVQFFIRNKGEVLECIKTFVKVYIGPLRVLNPSLQKVFIHSDMGEFDSQAVRDFLYKHAIFSTTSCAYMSEHNGVIERVWKTITDASICSLLLSELPEEYWEEARKCAAYVYNRIAGAHYGIHTMSPFEVYWGIKPRIGHFKIFGCEAYAMIPVKRKNHGERAEKGIFVGYQDRQPVGFRIYIPQKRTFIITYQATFVENPNGGPDVPVCYDDQDIENLVLQYNCGPTGSRPATHGDLTSGGGLVEPDPSTIDSGVKPSQSMGITDREAGKVHPSRLCQVIQGESCPSLSSSSLLPHPVSENLDSSLNIDRDIPIPECGRVPECVSDSRYEGSSGTSSIVPGVITACNSSNDFPVPTINIDGVGSGSDRSIQNGMDGTMGLDLGDVSSESSRLTSIGNSLALPVNSIEGVVVAGGVDSLPASAVPSGVSVSSSLVYPELDHREVISQNGLSEVSGSEDMSLDHREMFKTCLPAVSFPDKGGDGVAKEVEDASNRPCTPWVPGGASVLLNPWGAEGGVSRDQSATEGDTDVSGIPCAPRKLLLGKRGREDPVSSTLQDRVDEPDLSKYAPVAAACLAVKDKSEMDSCGSDPLLTDLNSSSMGMKVLGSVAVGDRISNVPVSNPTSIHYLQGETGISPYGRPKDVEKYDWLMRTRHIDDEDQCLYEVVQVYWCNNRRVPAIRRMRVSRLGGLENAGPIGFIQAEYAAMLTRVTNKVHWSSRYRRVVMEHSAESGFLGVLSERMIREGDVCSAGDYTATGQLTPKTLFAMLSTAVGYGDILSIHALTSSTVQVDIKIPLTHKQVLRSPQRDYWLAAELAEMDSFKVNKVMEPCWVPKGRKALRTKWVYTAKYDTNGLLKKYKARLVARGYEQIFGVDFDETFSPVTRLTSLRLLFALSAQLGLVTHQMDVKTAFLNADLDEETYIEVPDGVTPDVPCDGFRLRKALYGLKQSPRMWNININSFLLSLGFTALPNEPCLYFRRTGDKIAMIALYVDDMVIAGSDLELVQDIKNKLSDKYQMSDLGEVNQILGCEVIRDHTLGRIMMIQRLYIKQILKKFFPDIVLNSVLTPMAVQVYLVRSMCPMSAEEIAYMKNIPYRQAVGCLLWLAMGTRPDIAYAVSQVARFCENPGREHWEAVQRIFRYLAGTLDLGLVYTRTEKPLNGVVACDSLVVPVLDPGAFEVSAELKVYSDSDHARCQDTRRSVTGFIFYLAGAPICWQSRQQPTVALSSMEAEYMAACSTTQEALWLVAILKGLGFQQSQPVKILEDNSSAIAYSKNPTNHKYTKHIATKYHFVREQVELRLIELEKVSSTENVADVLTKPLPRDLHWQHTMSMLCTVMSPVVHTNVL